MLKLSRNNIMQFLKYWRLTLNLNGIIYEKNWNTSVIFCKVLYHNSNRISNYISITLIIYIYQHNSSIKQSNFKPHNHTACNQILESKPYLRCFLARTKQLFQKNVNCFEFCKKFLLNVRLFILMPSSCGVWTELSLGA